MGLAQLSDRWGQLNDLFHAAHSLPPEQREAFCRTACGEDEELRVFLTDLVLSADVADEGLREEITQLAKDVSVSETLTGQHIGNYKIGELLARGGMGEVYLASRADGAFEKTVAVKVVRQKFNREEFVRHFQTERQVLANLSHPNIPALVDAGQLDNGRPYFICDFIDGLPIHEYCQRNKLSINERLNLIGEVGSALQHAHSNLVLHLDIKPDNVLVEQDGTPRLLDFGVARLIGETDDGHRAFTPEYASPEQVREEPLSAASDVYSLGLLLYQLLAEHKPVSGTKFAPAATRLADQEQFQSLIQSPCPIPGLDQDLTAIVQKSTAQEPTDRYPSIEALMRDIKHHQMHLPVTAREGTTMYRATKFLRRYRVIAATVVAAMVVLIGFGLREAELRKRAEHAFQQSQIAEQKAAREAQTSQQIATFLTELFKVSDPSEARGNETTVREMLDRGAERIDTELKSVPGVQAQLMKVIGEVYQKLGLYDDALTHLQKAVDIGQALPTNNEQTGEVYAAIGNVHMRKGRLGDAEPVLLKSLSLLEADLGSSNVKVAKTLTLLGILRTLQSRFDESEQYHLRAVAINETLSDGKETDLANSLGNLAMNYARASRADEAIPLYRRAIEIEERVLGLDSPALATRFSNLASSHLRIGNHHEAIDYYERALAIHSKVLQENHPTVAVDLDNIGTVYRQLGRIDEAEKLKLRALEIRLEHFGENHPQTAVSLQNLGVLYIERGDLNKAQSYLERALAANSAVFPPGDASVALSKFGLSGVLRKKGNTDDAERLVLEALQDWTGKIPAGHGYFQNANWRLAMIYMDQERFDEAAPIFERGFALLESQREKGDPLLTSRTKDYANFLRLSGRDAQAAQLEQRMEDAP